MPVNETYISDNSGNRTPGDPLMSDPIAGSGLTLAMATSGNDYTQTGLTGGRMYAITFVAAANKVMFLSTTGVTSTAANIEWVIVAGQTIIVRIPLGSTILYAESDDNTTNAYLRKLAG